ncbi:F-box-like domain-containing protein [Pleurostoma richardsiae]|uniref:F-box-like domain-containing protein n=1 Tax=Pleurostoma richardsiae TaxID=41990 RepID=A0AA38RXK3_9PEZI|nr:F-box-like domain-containing protein [Pleurostoma richardsiae]
MATCTAALLTCDNHVGHLSIETTRRSSIERSPSAHKDQGRATAELASIMTAASNPASPGPSSPPLDQLRRLQDFVPPTRPSSTPFPEPEHGNVDIRCLSCPADTGLHLDSSNERVHHSLVLPSITEPKESPGVNLNDLPAEIHECILDHLFGYRVSATSKSSLGIPSVTRSWATALRHSRRKELSSLALVSSVWRVLVQERLYRHIKLKATVDSINEAFSYFAAHPHLRDYVRHIEVWFAVFQPKHGSLALSSTMSLPAVTADGLTNASYIIPTDNCSLEEAFYFVSSTFPEVCVLTLEGGERKKAPKVRHHIRDNGHVNPMPRIKSVRTLVCKGQWNLMRSADDFEAIVSALPNLQEWHGSYSKAKSKSYLSMATVLPRLPPALTSLNLNLEGVEYRRELAFPPYWVKVTNRLHFCGRLAEAARGLEHLSYTGRVCRGFFDAMARTAGARGGSSGSSLRSIDLTVKNCCRQVTSWNESGSGITDMNFIGAFEQLVLAGIRALAKLEKVAYLRIRYVDLDSPVPPLNPYFLLRDGWCSGVWSDEILAELNRVRPDARFEDLSDSFGEVGYNKDGRMVISPEFPCSRVLSLKLSNYRFLTGGIAIP